MTKPIQQKIHSPSSLYFSLVLIVLNFNPIVKDKNIPNPEIVTGDDVDDTSYNEIHDKLDDLLEKKTKVRRRRVLLARHQQTRRKVYLIRI